MIYKMKQFLKMIIEIPQEVKVSKAEFFLTIAVSALTGVVVGMFLSPRKNQRYGCDNGNYNYYNGIDDFDDFQFDEDDFYED